MDMVENLCDGEDILCFFIRPSTDDRSLESDRD